MRRFPNKNKFRKWQAAGLMLAIFSLAVGFHKSFAQTANQNARQINISAYIVNQENEDIVNGEYSVRFAIYTVNRETTDPYPSDADGGKRVWSETQNVQLKNGFLDAFIGAVNPLPKEINFTNSNYYLGIRINGDSEMVPRKRIGAIPLAINSFQLQGAEIGTQEGNIPLLGSKGLLDVKMMPTITELGTISNGVWEGDPIANGFIANSLTGKKYNNLTLTSNSDGFSIEGGTTARILTVIGGDITLNAPGAAGSIAYSDGMGYAFSASGTAGQVLLSGGSSTPVWGSVSGGVIAPDSFDFSELKDDLTLDANTTIDTNGFDLSIDGTLQATSLIISDQATIGTLGLNLYTNTSFIPSTTGLNLGSSENHWANLYADNLAVGTLDVGSSNLSGTSGEYFTINTDSTTDEDMGLRLYRSALNGYAALVWDAGLSRFNLFERESTGALGTLSLNNLYASGNVGIGNTSPTVPLQIGANWTGAVTDDYMTLKVGASAQGYGYAAFNGANGSSLDFYQSGIRRSYLQAQTSGTKILTVGAINLSLGTNNATNVTIQSGGNVGIGTTSPQSILNVNGIFNNVAGALTFGDGDTGIGEASDDTLYFAIAGNTNGLRLTSSGLNTIAGQGDNGILIKLGAASATNPVYSFGDSDTGIGLAGSDILSFIAGGTNVMNITNGSVGIGTASPSGLLHLSGTLGSNIVTNGTFDSDLTGWTGTNWAWSSGKAAHSSGSVDALTQAAATVVAGNYYKLTFDVAWTSGAGVTPSCGAWTGRTITATETGVTAYFHAFTTAALAFTPSATSFIGSVDNVVLTQVQSMLNLDDLVIGSTNDSGLQIHKTLSGTQNENALTIGYDANKTSGNDTGLLISKINTSSPGTSNFIDMQSGGTSMLRIDDAGDVRFRNVVSILETNGTIELVSAKTNDSSVRFKHDDSPGGSGGISVFKFTKNDATDRISNSSGIINFLALEPDYNQTSTAGATDLLINRTETAIGSGLHYFIEAQIAGSPKFQVTRLGSVRSLSDELDKIKFGNAVANSTSTNFQFAPDNSTATTVMEIDGPRLNTPTYIIQSKTAVNGTRLLSLTPKGEFYIAGSHTETSGTIKQVEITPTYNQTSGTAANTDVLINRTETAIGSGAQFLIDAQVGSATKFNVSNTGQGYFAASVGLGDATPDTTLKVVGSICAKADGDACFGSTAGNIYAANFIVDGTYHLPDYVFEPDYPLMPLTDLQNYINLNKHLPGVPSANDVIENGLNLSQMVPAILEKTEENTLYILGLNLKTDNNITTLGELKTSVDEQLDLISNFQFSISNQFSDLNDQISKLEIKDSEFEVDLVDQNNLIATLQTQIAELQNKLNAETNLAQIDLNTQDIAFIKLLLGTDRVNNPEDVDILGKLSAKTLATGGIEITMIDSEAPTIGEAVILPADGISDGKTIVIKTKAVNKNSKIFATPVGADPVNWIISEIKDGESFTISLDKPVEKEIRFNWWIIESSSQ